jgi:dUTPase
MEKETENTPDTRHASQMMDTATTTYTQVLHVQCLSDASTLPMWATPKAAGLDLHSAKDIMIAPRELIKVPTDLAIKPLPGT